ncbi:MAG: gliding motility-associated C-terminal domain-containing protein [Marinifilaceae bacterium]
MKPKLTYLLLLLSHCLCAQNLQVETGGLYIKGNTVFNLHGTSLLNDGEFKASDESILVLKSLSETLEINGDKRVSAHHLKVDANCSLHTLLQLSGDVNLQSGRLDLNSSELVLDGYILNEREESHITSSGTGEIVKTISLVKDQAVQPGNMGLEITAANNYTNIELRRGHQTYFNGREESIHRHFHFNAEALEIKAMSFSYLEAELEDIAETKLDVYIRSSASWKPLASASRNQNLNSISVLVNQKAEQVSLFPAVETALKIPSGFSPNGDGINDQFVILGLENYPNNKLVVFNRWGDVVHEASPYENTWTGTSKKGFLQSGDMKLVNGTYYYIFYRHNGDTHPMKGYVEIRSGKQ